MYFWQKKNRNACAPLDGGICLDILQNRWSPTYDVSAILTSIQSLLGDPNPNSPANSMAAQLFKENKREYDKRVKTSVEDSWADEETDREPDDLKSCDDWDYIYIW